MSNFFNCCRDNVSAIIRSLQSEWKCHCTNKDLRILFFAPRAQATPLWKLLSAIGWSYTNYNEKIFPLSPPGTSTQRCRHPGVCAGRVGSPDLSQGVTGFAFLPEMGLPTCHFVRKQGGTKQTKCNAWIMSSLGQNRSRMIKCIQVHTAMSRTIFFFFFTYSCDSEI